MSKFFTLYNHILVYFYIYETSIIEYNSQLAVNIKWLKKKSPAQFENHRVNIGLKQNETKEFFNETRFMISNQCSWTGVVNSNALEDFIPVCIKVKIERDG